jgi:hypothetical protein
MAAALQRDPDPDPSSSTSFGWGASIRSINDRLTNGDV